MKAAKWSEVRDEFAPDEDSEYKVVIVKYDEFKAPTDDDYITAPYKYKDMDGVPLPPEKPEISYNILTADDVWDVSAIREDPPDWIEEFEKE